MLSGSNYVTWVVLLTLPLSYLFFLGQILIHNCVHASAFKSRRVNRAVGSALAGIQLMHFDGWRVAHMIHHRHCNTAADPHRVDRPLLPYVLSHYFRISRAVWDARLFFRAIALPVTVAIAVVVWLAAQGAPELGVAIVVFNWLIPTAVSHALVAHFNYVTHVGLKSGRGSDTRSLKKGIWKLINFLTFNFYFHAEHHLYPARKLWRRAELSR